MMNKIQNPKLAKLKDETKELQEKVAITKIGNLAITQSGFWEGNVCTKIEHSTDELNFDEMSNNCLRFKISASFMTLKTGVELSPETISETIAIRYNNESLTEFRFFNDEENTFDETTVWQSDMDTFAEEIRDKLSRSYSVFQANTLAKT